LDIGESHLFVYSGGVLSRLVMESGWNTADNDWPMQELFRLRLKEMSVLRSCGVKNTFDGCYVKWWDGTSSVN